MSVCLSVCSHYSQTQCPRHSTHPSLLVLPTPQSSFSFTATTITLSNKQCSQSNKRISQAHNQNLSSSSPMPQSGETMISIKQEIHVPSSSQAPSSKTQCHNPTPTSLLMPQKTNSKSQLLRAAPPSAAPPTITLSNKQCSQTTRHSSTKLIPSSIIKTQCHNLDKHNAHKQDIHLPTSFQAPIIKTQCHNLDKATIALNQTRENLSPKLIPSSIIKNPIPQIQHHHLLGHTQKTNSKFPISDVVTQLKDPNSPPSSPSPPTQKPKNNNNNKKK